MNKILDLFKNKNFVRLFSLILAGVILISSCLAVMLPSYLSYNSYYNKLVAEREHEKYLNSLPLELKGIKAKLADGVEYYTDGKASPANGDLEVVAQFTEKGKDFDKILSDEDFELEIPEDFKANGGTLNVTYTYQPEKDADSETDPEPVVKTADVDVSLTKVALKQLKIIENPYRVYYSDAMNFAPNGIKVKAIYNNGHEVALTEKDITIEDTATLTAGKEAVKISYTQENVTVKTDVAIKVDTVANYDDGAVLKIEPAEKIIVTEGQKISEVKSDILALYESGNRLILADDEYSISGNTVNASFVNNCLLEVSLNDNQTINCKAAAAVQYKIEAEEAVNVGGTSKTVDEKDENDVTTQTTVMQGYASSNTITVSISSSGLVKGDLYLRLANYGTTAININQILTAKVNGRLVYLPSQIIAKATEENAYSFNKYLVFNPVLNSGSNEIVLTFKNMTGVKLAVDNIIYETRFDGEFYSNVAEYIALNADNTDFTVSAVGDWTSVTGGTYAHGLCTDGEFIYSVRTTYSVGNRAYVICKQNKTTGEVIATSSATEVKGSEALAGVTYFDGKIIVYFEDGGRVAINSSLTGTWQAFDGFNFKGFETKALYDVVYVASRKEYAVRTASSTITVFGDDKEVVGSFTVGSDSNGALKRITADANYIYCVYSSDGKYQPAVRVYDWTGKAVARFIVENNNNVMNIPAISKTNVQGIVVLNDDLYFSVLRFGQGAGYGDSSLIIKASYPEISDELEVDLTFGEYTASCVDSSTTPTAKGTAITTIDKGSYSMGGCSDGEYMYISVDAGGNTNAVVYKLDSNYEIVATSATINLATAEGDNARLFIKDDILYCIGGSSVNGKIFELPLNQFGNNARFVESTLSFATVGNIKGVTYNENAERFALIEYNGKQLIITDKNGNSIKQIGATYTGMSISSISSDNEYIYVSYIVNNQTVLPIDVFTWDGEKVATVSVSDINLGQSAGKNVNYNVQSVFTHNGSLYASVCSWDKGYSKYHLWKIA